MSKHLLTLLFILCSAYTSFSQKVTFDPIDWSGGDSLTITVDLSGTSLSGNSEDLYLWAWTQRGHGYDINAVYNGSLTASDPASKMTAMGNNIYKKLIFPEEYFNVSKELLQISGIEFLLKTVNNSAKTIDLGPFKPSPANGIATSSAWQADKPTRLLVDVKGTDLEGNTDPLYLWGWYNTGSSGADATENGTWSNSKETSKMTQIPGTNTWYLDFIPTVHYGTAAANLTPQTLFGLLKKKGGGPQTPNFGKDQTLQKYQLQKINASNVTLNPAIPTKTETFTLTFHAQGALAGYTGDVFLHSAVVTEGLNSTAWNYTVGEWGSPESSGQMTRSITDPDTYEIEIESIKDYYEVPDSINVFKIMAVFRSADGSIQEKDGTADYQLPVLLQAGLEIREPKNSFATGIVGQPFRITGFNPASSDFELFVNNNLIYSQAGTQRASQLYIPATVGEYWVKVKSVVGSVTYIDSVLVNVCDNTSRGKIATLPAGMKYGINYPEDTEKAILVLHAPTESIETVHVIGDFNDWKAKCDYVMNYDPAKFTFWIELNGLVPNQEYVFQYLIDGKTRIGDPYTKKVSDPWNDEHITPATYPGLIPYPEAARAKPGETPTIASVLQTNQPEFEWDETGFTRKPMEQLNIYQLHFRDFTTEGTFLAAAEKLDYLQRLGINAIATLPVSEFEGNDSWGYNPNFYFAVDKAYGTQDDFKYFVNECHKRGMAVLGDMVLNHAFGTNAMARMYWDEINNRPAANNPWFNAEHNFQNPAAHWGNDFNHTSIHTQVFVDSVINYWVTEFKIDGIRFDFTKGFSNTPYPGTCGDDWGTCYDGARAAILKRMTDQMRLVDNGTPGVAPYVIMEHLELGAEDKELADYGIGLWSGAIPNHDYAQIAMGWSPSDVSSSYYKNKNFNLPVWISYMESHDEERIAYKAITNGNGTIKTSDSVRAQFLQTAAVMNLLLRGPRQIWQFGELGYDYSINYNGRTGKKPVRWDYFEDTHRQRIFSTYSKLFWLRNNLPGTFYKDIDNYGGNKTDFANQFKRYHYYSTVGDTAVTIVANTANSIISGNPDFNSGDAVWYDFMSGDTLSHTTSMTLQPGQFRVLMNKLPYKKPSFELTHAVRDTLGHDSTHIKVTFSEKILKVEGVLGREILASDLTGLFKLTDSLNTAIPFTGSLSGKEITLIPDEKLSHGRKYLQLKPGIVQNYGGLKYQDTTFVFRIEPLPVSIDIDTVYTVCQGQEEINTAYSNVSGEPDKYEIVYSAAALTAGFENVISQTHDFETGNLTLQVPEDVEAGIYTGTLKFLNSSSHRDTSFILSIEVEPKHILTLSSGVNSDQQELCLGEEITPIKYTLSGGAESATVTGLPSGVTGTIDEDELEISGLPTAAGVFTYTIITSGNACKKDTLTGNIIISALASSALAGDDLTLCPSANASLAANLPANDESGKWTIYSGPAGASPTVGTFTPKDTASDATFTPNRGIGEYTLVWTISNTGNCNANSDTLKIMVQDTTKPVFISPETNLTGINLYTSQTSCTVDKSAIETSPNFKTAATIKSDFVSDDCEVDEVTNNLNSLESELAVGVYDLIWTVSDVTGNLSTYSQTVTVIDTITPVLTAPADITVATDASCQASEVAMGNPTASDNCNYTVTNNAPSTFNLGTTEVIWTVTDASGNVATAIQQVTVSDSTQPVFTTVPTAVNVQANHTECTANNVDLGTPPTVSDNCSGTITLTAILNGTPVTASTVFANGINEVKWLVTDSFGNKDSVMQQVNVVNPIQLEVTSPLTGVGFVNLTLPEVTSGSTLPAGTVLSYHYDELGPVNITNPESITISGTYYIKATSSVGCSVIKSVTVTVTPNPDCPDHIVKESPTDDINGTGVSVKANKTITASNKINTGASVAYQSGGSITLMPGTVISSGAVFKAEIKGCDN